MEETPEVPTVCLAIGILPSNILILAAPLPHTEQTFRTVESKLEIFAGKSSVFPARRGAICAMREQLRKNLGNRWMVTVRVPPVSNPVRGLTLFIKEEGTWTPSTTYHFNAENAAA